MQARVSRSLGKLSQLSSTTAGLWNAALVKPVNSRNRRLIGAVFCGWLAICCMTTLAADQNNILLDFSATWCGPCQQMSDIVSKLERQGYPIRKVDVDVEKALTQQFKVESIPCFVLVANGREVTRITGATDERELKRMMNMLPKQNVDDALVGKSSRNGNQIPVTNAGAKSSDDKKLFPKIPPIFARNSDVKLVSTDSDVVRGQNPGSEMSADGFARDPMSVATRIRVKDGSRIHYGSGSIIDSQPGRSVILTCGHIFRDLSDDATVEVDVFTVPNSKPQTVIGQILKFDLKSDLGLLVVATPQQLPAIKLAFGNEAVTVKDRVVSIGCGGGERPTREDHSVTAVNKYQGPENVECTGIPQQGRSGGGLFLGSELVGVCIAADPKEKRGIYTGMKPVAGLLAKSNLAHLMPSSLQSTVELAATDELPKAKGRLGAAVAMNEAASNRNDDDVASLIEAAARSSGGTMAASGDYVGAEIVCIVRSKTPGVMSRIVIVNQASNRFVDDLLHESSGGSRPDPTATVQVAPVKQRGMPDTVKTARVAMQKPSVAEIEMNEADLPTETSFEAQRYRRKRN